MNSGLIDKMLEKRIFTVVVKPNSKKNSVLKFDIAKNAFIVEIKAEARNNKANIELVRYLSKLLKHDVKIIKGLKSKKKVIQLI